MPRPKTGTLIEPGADGIWRGRLTRDEPDGSKSRPLYSLGTADKSLARTKLAKLAAAVARGDETAFAEAIVAVERVRTYADAWHANRKSAGVGMAEKEFRALELHAFGAIGSMPLGDVRPSHIRSILNAGVAGGLKKKTIAYIRGCLRRLFGAALEAELIAVNPVAAVKTPKLRETKKSREILTDDEFAKFMACAEADLELRMLALASRCEGGMRTGDLHYWDWTQIDRVDFADCIIPRAKTETPQQLTIPDPLRTPLRSWWDRAGRPANGPVFPVRRGPRAGEQKSQANSYAKRLRRDLFRAGVHREAPIEVPALKPGQRTDLGKTFEGMKLAPNPVDPLYFETAATLPVDFHSFRRAFSTALAEAGVNAQHAMSLASHADARTHGLYVMATKAMRTVPDAALPRLLTTSLPGMPTTPSRDDSPARRDDSPDEIVAEGVADAPSASGNVTGRDVSRSRGGESLLSRRIRARNASRKMAPAAGLEST